MVITCCVSRAAASAADLSTVTGRRPLWLRPPPHQAEYGHDYVSEAPVKLLEK